MTDEITRNELLAATGGRPHDDEFHLSWGAICFWKIGGKIYEEHQPDIGYVKWYVRE